MEKIHLILERTNNGWNVTEVRDEKQPAQMAMALETKPKRTVSNRKSPVKVTNELVTTVKFMLNNGKTKEEVAVLTGASVETIARVRSGHYDKK
jgi:hypothetical protein